MAEISTKPYLIRALYEWCVDSGFTPQLLVAVDGRTRVPPGFVKDGQIALNISAGATRNLTLDNDWIQFSSRFGGVSHELSIPVDRVMGRDCISSPSIRLSRRIRLRLPRQARPRPRPRANPRSKSSSNPSIKRAASL